MFSPEEEISIPSEIDGVPVTSFGEGNFDSCSNLREISIPDSVSSIGALAFDSTPWFEEKQTVNPIVIVNGIRIYGQLSLID